MVVTCSTFGMVKMPLYQIVGVIAVRDRLMPTTGAMFVLSGVASAIMAGRARGGMAGVDCNHMLINVICVRMVKVAIVKVVHMSFVLDSGVSARWAMFVRVSFVKIA
jgi:hypothetical protein